MVTRWRAVVAGLVLAACQGAPALLKQGEVVMGTAGSPGVRGEARLYADRLEFTPQQGGETVRVMLDAVEAFQLDQMQSPNGKKITGLVLLDKNKQPLIEIIVDNWRDWGGPLGQQLKKR